MMISFTYIYTDIMKVLLNCKYLEYVLCRSCEEEDVDTVYAVAS